MYSDADIVAALAYPCCQEQCCSHFTLADIRQKRRSYHYIRMNEKRQWLHKELQLTYKGTTRMRLCGQHVCMVAVTQLLRCCQGTVYMAANEIWVYVFLKTFSDLMKKL